MLSRLQLFVLFLFSLCLLPIFCSDKGPSNNDSQETGGKNLSRKDIQSEYDFIQAEMQLVKTGKPYLVLDFENDKIMIKLKGAAVWSDSLDYFDSESDDPARWSRRFVSDKGSFIRPVLEEHLFDYTKKTPDSILVIVGKVVNVDPSKLQREVPGKFQLLWDRNLTLEIRTNIIGTPTSRFQNTMQEVRRVLQRPFGESFIAIKMTPEEALTLYGISQPGLATLINPAS
jgi:hypothetical protein